MANCQVCGADMSSLRYADGRRRYCREACKQKAYRQRLDPDRLALRKANDGARHRRWRKANPERERELNRRWVAANREKTRDNARRFLAAHPEYARAKNLRRYGLTAAEYEALHAAQGGLCGACGHPETTRHASGKIRRLAVDHDHATGAVRALLCRGCNLAIGNMGESPERLEAAARYLRAHTARKAS